jgi:hypothetical protein
MQKKDHDDVLIADILKSNISGVDINAASVEIARLALWLHTARGDKPLSSLDENIRARQPIIEAAKRYVSREVAAAGSAEVKVLGVSSLRLRHRSMSNRQCTRLLAPRRPVLRKGLKALDTFDLPCMDASPAVRDLHQPPVPPPAETQSGSGERSE